MLQKSILFAALLAFSTLSFAQQTHRQAGGDAVPDAMGCRFAYTSGSGINQTNYCLSNDGNIVQFSRPSNTEYLQSGEGYGVCDVTTSKSYYDYALWTSDNWGSTVVTEVSPTKRKFVRTTTDGIWELSQSITQIRAKGSSPGAAQVTMSLENLSGATRSVYLLRYAGIDVGSNYSDDKFDFTWDTAYGSNPGFSFGLGLTNNTFTYGHDAFTQYKFFGPDPCAFTKNINFGPWVGDGSIGQVYSHTLHPGSKLIVTMIYRPM